MESMLAQAGLGAAGGAMGAVAYVVVLGVISIMAFVSACFILPALVRLIWDVICQRDLLAESEVDRRMEGRLFPESPESRRRARKTD